MREQSKTGREAAPAFPFLFTHFPTATAISLAGAGKGEKEKTAGWSPMIGP